MLQVTCQMLGVAQTCAIHSSHIGSLRLWVTKTLVDIPRILTHPGFCSIELRKKGSESLITAQENFDEEKKDWSSPQATKPEDIGGKDKLAQFRSSEV